MPKNIQYKDIKQTDIPVSRQEIQNMLTVTQNTIRQIFRNSVDGGDISPAIEEVQDILLEAVPLIRQDILNNIETSKENIDKDDLLSAIRRADVDFATHLFNASISRMEHRISSSDDGIRDDFQRSLESGGILGAVVVENALSVEASFDSSFFRLEEWIDRHVAEFVSRVGLNTKLAIQDVVKRSLVDGMGVDVEPIRRILSSEGVSDYIINKFGLTKRQAGAVDRFFAAQIREGVPTSLAKRRANRYASRLLDLRAERIARTEIITTLNRGQQFAYEQLINSGVVDPRVWQKIWITVGDDSVCPICLPLNNTIIGIRKEFPVNIRYSFGGQVIRQEFMLHPPAHVLGRCSTGLIRVG